MIYHFVFQLLDVVMTKFIKSILILSFIIFSISASYAAQKTYGSVSAKFIKNYDGDTITVNIPGYPAIVGKAMRIRVNGIDTPEMRGKCKKEKTLARNAKNLVNSILRSAKTVELKNMKRGKYFRIVADVYADNKNLSDILIKNNLAVYYNGGHKSKDWCA
jgi:endonuclease YncB( thermonuclease family)